MFPVRLLLCFFVFSPEFFSRMPQITYLKDPGTWDLGAITKSYDPLSRSPRQAMIRLEQRKEGLQRAKQELGVNTCC